MDEAGWISQSDLAAVVREHGAWLDMALRDLPGGMFRQRGLALGPGGGGTDIEYRAEAIGKLFADGKLHYNDMSRVKDKVAAFKATYFPEPK
ncbi:MAG: hypothetical protein SFT92_06440 [Rickettsiales bacterium]|nr:hypothetical protein [Rickettsiales bacterium]